MKIQGRIFFYGWIFSTAFAFTAPHVQVRIGKNLDQILIGGMDLKSHIFIKNKKKQYLGRKSIQFNCQGKGQLSRKPVLLASLSSPTGLLSWHNRHYRGDLLVTTSSNLNSCDLVQQITMENYLSSLLAKEMNGRWPIEALKAQAIAARTYALFQKKQRLTHLFALENSEKDQVSGSFFDGTPTTRKASMNTKGFILVNKKGKMVPTFFHSKCGGKTYLPQKVWSKSVEGYHEVICPFCHKHGTKNWKRVISQAEIRPILIGPFLNKKNRHPKDSFQLVLDKKDQGFIRFYWAGNIKKVSKSYLRKKLGRKKLPSNNFTIHQGHTHLTIKGKGFGHGVGMCQYGAFEMARQGKSYRQILAHYYPQLKIKKLY